MRAIIICMDEHTCLGAGKCDYGARHALPQVEPRVGCRVPEVEVVRERVR